MCSNHIKPLIKVQNCRRSNKLLQKLANFAHKNIFVNFAAAILDFFINTIFPFLMVLLDIKIWD